MSRSHRGKSRGVRRSELNKRLSLAHRKLLAHTRLITGADSELMKEAGKVLRKSIQKRLATRAPRLRVSLNKPEHGKRRMYGEPSDPGESPHRISGRLHRSIRSVVKDGERTVLSNDFRAKWLEFGLVVAPKAARMSQKKRFGKLLPESKQHMIKATKGRTIEPRPFMRPGLEDARPELRKIGAQILRKEGVPTAVGLARG